MTSICPIFSYTSNSACEGFWIGTIYMLNEEGLSRCQPSFIIEWGSPILLSTTALVAPILDANRKSTFPAAHLNGV
jgi:hypothetical protein